MSDTGFNFEIKVDGVDKALTGTSQVAKHLEMLQEVLPKLADESRRSFHRVTSYTLRVEASVLRLSESVRDLGLDFSDMGSYGASSFQTVNTSAKEFIRTVVASRSRVRLLSEEMRSMQGFGGSTNQQQQTNNTQTQTPQQPNQNSGSASQGKTARKIPETTIKSVNRYADALKNASDGSLQLELDSANLHSVFGNVGSAASDAKQELDSFSKVGSKAVFSVYAAVAKLATKTLQAKSAATSLVAEFAKLAKNLNLNSNMNLNLNVSVKMPKVVPVLVKFNPNTLVTMQAKISNVNAVNVKYMTVNGKVSGTNNQNQTNNNNNSGGRGNNKNDPASMIRQYVGVALASVASYNVVRSGFSGTVEEARFNNEWQSMTRELAAVFKPLMSAATDATRYVRQQLEKLDEGNQNLLMYGALGTVGAIGLHKMGMLGAVAKTSGAGLMTGGRGAATVAGAAVRGLGGVKAFTGIGTVLASGQMIAENALNRRDTRRLDRITNTPISKLSVQERQALLKTGEDVENMTGEQRDGIRNEFINATRRQKERNLADQGMNPDGTRMGFFSRFTNQVGNLFGDIGIGGQERRQDMETRRGVLGLDAAAKRRFAMTGKGERNPFGDLNNITDEDMKKAANPERRRVMLAQAGFGEAGGLREELQIEALKLASVDPNAKKQEDANEKLIRVLEALDARLRGDKPEERPAPANMLGGR